MFDGGKTWKTVDFKVKTGSQVDCFAIFVCFSEFQQHVADPVVDLMQKRVSQESWFISTRFMMHTLHESWLAVWNMFYILGISSSQLTHIVQKG